MTVKGGGQLKLLGVVRVSVEELAEAYGPAIQEGEVIADAAPNGYQLIAIRRIVEPATIDLEERGLFLRVIKEAIDLNKRGECDGLVFSRCDRLSRQFDAALQIALDCRKNGLTLRFVRENQWLRTNDPTLSFVMFILQAFGVHIQTSVSLANLTAGKHKAAEAGKLPAGVGLGFLGYDLVNKRFEPNSFITVVDEVLERGYKGDSINQITRDLQHQGVLTPQNKLITRSTVALILRKAKRYAGIWEWGGHEIKGLIPPRVTLEKAEKILSNLKRNQERSHGFGKRKWLTGRVICGLCGRRYCLRVKAGCCCRRGDPLVTQPPCLAPRMTWNKLSDRAWLLLMANLLHVDTLFPQLERRRVEWQKQRADIEKQIEDLRNQTSKLHEKRRLLSWQHSERVISDQELLDAMKGIWAEAELLDKRLSDLKQFLQEPAPLDPAMVGPQLKEAMSYLIAMQYETATDETKDKFAELYNLKVTIFPADSPQSYRLQLTASIPLDVVGIVEGSQSAQMVFTSSRGG